MSGAIRDPKEVIWVGPLRKDLKSFPRPVQRATGIALYATPKAEIAVIRERLKVALKEHRERQN